MKPVILSALMLICIAFGVALVPACERLDRVFSSSNESGSATSPAVGPAQLTFSSEPGADIPQPPAQLYRVTAYCPEACCCGKFADGMTASGKPAVGKIVAAPSTVPFGTILEIPGYGIAEVQDRGGAITGNRMDVLFATHQEALEWGVQELKVRIVE